MAFPENHADIFSYQAAGTGMVRAGLSVRGRQASHLITRALSLSGANAEAGMEFRDGAKGQRAIRKPNLEPFPPKKLNSIVTPSLGTLGVY